MLTGREGKYFHPLAFTKSFAMLGVAIISVTLVPALIPIFIKGRIRGEEESWIVRSFINIYKPLLTWALPRRNLVMWGFAVLLILAAGMFPLQAVFGQGASETAWRDTFLLVFTIVTSLTVVLTTGKSHGLLRDLLLFLLSCAMLTVAIGLMLAGLQAGYLLGGVPYLGSALRWTLYVGALIPLLGVFYIGNYTASIVVWRTVSLVSLVIIGLCAYGFPKIGVSFMPPLDEGTTLDMPVTVPRASVTQAADDLKARDALLRGFPEVESVIGKSGRYPTIARQFLATAERVLFATPESSRRIDHRHSAGNDIASR
jgi:multidrug efflux pump subunit AcrB